MKKERPISPHLQIYKPQITSMMSITHRASVVATYIMLILFAIFIFAYAFMPDLECLGWLINSDEGVLLLRAVLIPYTFVLFFYFFSEIRHICWDLGIGFEIETAYKSAYAIIAGTIIFASITWIIIFLG
ncbi:MAG: succinate dehydrogenase, cytochrome b556 subunit [Rickettsiales bacterium]|nr:succinate dehydrogenase, cytochrome b556 subunit [Rickettsiales bacterium]